jgi:hypothetical protein
MRRQPGSGISAEDEQIVLRFLRYYAAELRRAKTERERGGGSPASSESPVLEGGAP